MPIVALGLSHHTAPVEVREGVAVSPEALPSVLKQIGQAPEISECAMLATCNRSEVYMVCSRPQAACDAVVETLSRIGGVDAARIREHLFVHQNADAVRHLFEVAAGLDSMIMGEPQIAGQVKDAGAAAMEAGSSRTVLNRLLRSAIEASKRARTETEIGLGAVSVSFAAVALARKIFGDLSGQSALVLGAGEMSELTARHLVENGVRALTVTSRTLERAQDLADRVGGRALPWQGAMTDLHHADIVMSATGSPDYILSRDAVAQAMHRRRNQQMFLIDIAVPRDIDPDAGALYNVVLYDIDDLQAAVGANMKKRQVEAERARRILAEEEASFLSWLNSLDVVPAIVALRERFREVMEAELDWARMSDFTEEQQARVGNLLRRYMNKLLHEPVTQLKKTADSDDGVVFVDALVHLFGLRPAPKEDEAEGAAGEHTQRFEEVRS